MVSTITARQRSIIGSVYEKFSQVDMNVVIVTIQFSK